MSSENSPDITWQKIAVLVTVMALAFPIVARFAWRVVFPQDRLLYAITEPIEGEGFAAVAIEIVNEGGATQNDIIVHIPKNWNPDQAYLDVSTPRRISVPSDDGKASVLIKAQNKGYTIPVGSLRSGEKVRVTLISKAEKDGDKPSWGMYDTRVESATTLALQADGPREPDFEDSLHGVYFQAAPYLLAILLSLILLIFSVSVVFDAFFDTNEKKIGRLWKQMNLIQDKIEKERWRR